MGFFGRPAVPFLEKTAKTPDATIRGSVAVALNRLAEMKVPDAFPLVIDLMQDKDWDVRCTAGGFFTSSDLAFASPLVREAMKHKSPLVRANAADAAAWLELDFAKAEKALLQLFNDGDAIPLLEEILKRNPKHVTASRALTEIQNRKGY